MERINLEEKFSRIDIDWVPTIIAELNGQCVKAVTFVGEYVWHHHENEDEMFLVVEGSIEMHFRDHVVRIGEGEFIVVPRGVEHKPAARARARVLLFEPATTRNTGNVDHEHTIEPENLPRA